MEVIKFVIMKMMEAGLICTVKFNIKELFHFHFHFLLPFFLRLACMFPSYNPDIRPQGGNCNKQIKQMTLIRLKD
jgi:hypothetical protein